MHRLAPVLRRSLLPLALPALALPLSAQTIVTDGDDLFAVVAAAADGDTIEIQSDATFVGTLDWAFKSLTIRAGAGFAPTIRGADDEAALDLNMNATQGVLRGLRLEGGANTLVPTVGSWFSVDLNAFGTAVSPGSIELRDCELAGPVRVGSTNSNVCRVTLDGVVGDDYVLGTAGTSATLELVLTDGCDVGEVFTSAGLDGVLDLQMQDSIARQKLTFQSDGGGVCTGTVRRTRVFAETGVDVSEQVGGTTDVFLESCLLVGDGSGTGIESFDDAALRAVNVTVTGFAVGIGSTATGASFANLALFDNADDLNPFVLPGVITSSLIEDGTFAGLDGNFDGTPSVDQAYAFFPGSIGIDAGDSTLADLGPLDLRGEPRVQDGDGDGTPTVNVGALETVTACTAASSTAFNGSGINPKALTVLAPPVLGGQLEIEVAPGPGTLLTGVAYGLAAPTPIGLPGFGGELLLLLTPSPIIDLLPAGETHVRPLPNSSNLCGRQIDAQGLWADATGGIQFLDGVALTLGN